MKMSINFIRFLGIFVITVGAILNGQTVISGDLSKFVLDSANNPFIVDKDVEVPTSKKVIIGEGCIFLFNNFSKLIVYGGLKINGTEVHPAIFTSFKDPLYHHIQGDTVTQFDWSGVEIRKNADSIVLNNFKLMYSTYGIRSDKSDITIYNSILKFNGGNNFSVLGKPPFSIEDTLFSYKQEIIKMTTLSISSFPCSAEVYINKKPNKRIKPDGVTPATFKNPEHASISLTLFKKGFQDTTQLLDIKPNAVNNYEFSLGPLRQESVSAQNKLLRDRLHVQIGRYCFIASPVFIAIGAGLLYFANKNQDKADEAKSYLARSMEQSDQQYTEMQQQYTDEKSKAKVKRGLAVGSFVMAAAALGFGIYLYF